MYKGQEICTKVFGRETWRRLEDNVKIDLKKHDRTGFIRVRIGTRCGLL
jgi:hypothetical protein